MEYLTGVDLVNKWDKVIIKAGSKIKLLHACNQCGKFFISHTEGDVTLKTHVFGTFLSTCKKFI